MTAQTKKCGMLEELKNHEFQNREFRGMIAKQVYHVSGASLVGGPGGPWPPNDLGLKGKELNIWALDHIF